MNPTVYRLAFQTLAQQLAEVSADLREIAIGSMTIPATVLGVAFVMMVVKQHGLAGLGEGR